MAAAPAASASACPIPQWFLELGVQAVKKTLAEPNINRKPQTPEEELAVLAVSLEATQKMKEEAFKIESLIPNVTQKSDLG